MSAPASDHPDKAGTKKSDRRFPWWRILEGMALVAAIVLAFFTYLMWRDSHKDFVIDEQAWIRVASRTIEAKDIKAGAPLRGEVLLNNSGKTPARKLESEFRIVLVDNAGAVNFDYSAHYTHANMGTLNPNDPQHFPVIATGETITTVQAQDLLNGRAYIAIYGRGQFDDFFGKPHWFRYCGWSSYYNPGEYNARGCTDYNDFGDGKLPKASK